MRWYLLVGMIIFSTSTVQSAPNFVPSLEYEQETIEDMDDIFMRISQPTMPKIPKWQMVLQQWGSLFVAHLLRFKQYANNECQKIKMIMYGMIFRNNAAVRRE